jgi:tetratricopeptide (TPR) repeat protein
VADIARSDQQLEKATTPSLAALQLFTAAAGMPNEHAAQLLKQAVERDPEFASAHLYLGMATMELPGQRAASLESFRRAMELADKASERERLFIFQTFYGLQLGPGDLQKAIHYGEVLTSLYPDFDAGLKNQADLLLQAARPDEAATLYDRLLDVRPNAFSLANDAWQSFAGNQPAFFKVRRPDLAQHFRAKAKEIAVRSHDLAAFWQPLIEASERWEAGDSAGAAVVLDEAHPADEWQEHTLALAYLSLGKLNKAESVAASAAAPENIRMLAAFLRNGVPGLRLYADHHSPPPAHVAGIPTILYARVGGFRSAGDAALPFEQQHAREMAIAGLNAMNARQYSKAVVELRAAVESTFSIAQQMFLANSLASALEHEGQTAEAVAVLEKLEPYGDDEITAGLLRPLILGHLARLYRLTGNRARADALDAIVKMSLAVADPDYSLDRQLADSRLAYKAPRQ